MRKILLSLVVVAVMVSIAYLESLKSPMVQNVSLGQDDIPLPSSEFTCADGRCTSTRGASSSSASRAVPISSPSVSRIKEKLHKYARAKEISTPDGFINTDALTLGPLVGKKIILVDFWTYSCINCQRTQPYLNAWYEKYADQGLEIVGIHTPEFQFEHDYANVVSAVAQFNIKYPVVLDNDYSTWNAYENRYWPRKYLIDIDGFIVYDHIGEGAYEETEAKIQALLRERALVLGAPQNVAGGTVVPVGGGGVVEVGSPETYFGSLRNQYFGNGIPGDSGVRMFAIPQHIVANKFYLSGKWNISDEYAEGLEGGNRLQYRYNAKDIYLVASGVGSVRLKITKDGRPLTASDKGEDVVVENGESFVNIKEDRLYKLIQEKTAGTHTIEITSESSGFKVFAFTFG